MNIRCPQCQTVFKVDPSRIPEGGARARCARCGSRFMVRPPAAVTSSPALPSQPSAQTQAHPTPPTPAAPPRAPSPGPSGYGQVDRAAAPSPGAAIADRNRRPQTPDGGVSPLGSKDPNARAERLARAIVSDIVAYHPDRRDRSLSEGTLRTEFRDEIMKSWDEYVAQVGLPMAKSTPYFRDALNMILAKGQQLF
jgi:predicted Zn finger-like uncharacterized protein